jgi:hypothetical protein
MFMSVCDLQYSSLAENYYVFVQWYIRRGDCHPLSGTFHITDKESFVIKFDIRMKSSIFWYKTPYSPLKINRRFGGTYTPNFLVPSCFTLVLLLGLFFDHEYWGVMFSETSADLQLTARRYNPRLWELQILHLYAFCQHVEHPHLCCILITCYIQVFW